MKVALIMEEPKCCGECMLSGYINILELDKDIEDRKIQCKLTLSKCLYTEKLDNCPLKSLPDYIELTNPSEHYASSNFYAGWNFCIDTLEKYAVIQEGEIKKEKERSLNETWISMKKQ